MNNLSEHQFQNQVISFLLYSNYLVIRFNSGAAFFKDRLVRYYFIHNNHSSSGLADVMAIKNNRTIFLEIKTKTGKASASQIAFKKLCKNHHIEYYIINSLTQLEGIING